MIEGQSGDIEAGDIETEDTANSDVVIGAGPAGLTAAWHLARRGRKVTVLESDPRYVGGLARSMILDGHRFDVGPHRFYTKSPLIQDLWREMLPKDWVKVSRLTRIHYENRFIPYPLEVGKTLRAIGPWRAARAAWSAIASRLRPRRPEQSFEDWVVNRFGHELYATFFRSYTEKVWGIPCAEMNKNWAAQRIRGLSFFELVKSAVLGRSSRATSLIEEFQYPRLGAGQLWEAVRDAIRDAGGDVLLDQEVKTIHHREGRILSVETSRGDSFEGANFYASMTLKNLVNALSPSPPEAILRAGNALLHRDFLTVALLVPRHGLFPDQWIYVHDPGVRVARITNYANWSEAMCRSKETTALSLDYFCDRDDELWASDDRDLIALAVRELRDIGVCHLKEEPKVCVSRFVDAYPIYDDDYLDHRHRLKEWMNTTFFNLHPAGRKGLHNYNSQDHAMMSGTLAVHNALDGRRFDVWSINTEQEYAELGEGKEVIEERLVPRKLTPSSTEGEA